MNPHSYRLKGRDFVHQGKIEIDVNERAVFIRTQGCFFVYTNSDCFLNRLAMYDVIQSSKAPIRVFCIGRAYSMAAVLFASGKHGRYMLPNSELMIHEPFLENRVGGNSSSIKSISESLLETKKKMNSILSKHTGKSEEEVEKATRYDHYYSPKESKEFGLCDQIVNFSKIVED